MGKLSSLRPNLSPWFKLLEAVGDPDQGERVLLASLALEPDALLDMSAGYWTVGADVVGQSSRHGFEHRPADPEDLIWVWSSQGRKRMKIWGKTRKQRKTKRSGHPSEELSWIYFCLPSVHYYPIKHNRLKSTS